MAQWLNMFTGNTHGSLVRDRADLVSRAVETWNATDVDNRTLAMRKKLVRLADNLLAAMIKEKKAFLDGTLLDQRSEDYKKKIQEIEQLRFAGVDSLLRKMGVANWKPDTIDEP
ncbi:MAG: hypothetical protein MUC43_20405 [Pirellula sp.]|nr:hypothetical protein [Pirellula sp.]